LEAFPPLPFSLSLEDDRLELELPDLEELLPELPLELLLDEEEDPDLLREREELKYKQRCDKIMSKCHLFLLRKNLLSFPKLKNLKI
jgi:hypothetical protein